MSTPLILYGKDGEQWSKYAAGDQRWPLGTQLKLQDGRSYRFVKAGAAALVVGDLLQSPAIVANDVGRTGIAAAVGSYAPTLTLGGATTANLYAEGYWENTVANASAVGGADQYKIDNHLAGTTAVVFNLAANNAIRVAIDTTTRVCLIPNPYAGVIQAPVTALTAPPCGIAVSTIALTGFGWIQIAGVAAVLTHGTVVAAQPVAYLATAGAVDPLSATIASTVTQPVIGVVIRVSAAAAWSVVLLNGFP
jgi:hypothetical protein